MYNEEINRSLVETIKGSEFEKLATDFGEITFDQLSEFEGVAKDIPVIGSIVKLAKIGFSVRDILLFKKLGKFLWSLRDIPQEKRIELIQKLEKDSHCKSDIGAKIMLLLERADDFEKPKMIANAFKAYLNDELSYNQLQKINFAIDHLFVDDIEEFRLFYRNPEHLMDESSHQNIALCGFAYLIQVMGGGTKPKISDLGTMFAEKVLNKD